MSLLVVVVELDNDSPLGACSVCCESVSLGVQTPVPLRESCWNEEKLGACCPPVNMEISDGRCWCFGGCSWGIGTLETSRRGASWGVGSRSV